VYLSPPYHVHREPRISIYIPSIYISSLFIYPLYLYLSAPLSFISKEKEVVEGQGQGQK
jgi:hypothetical protein